MTNLIRFLKTKDLKDYSLIIPSVSVGNVPQLTVDLIIATHASEKVATIWHPAIIPSVGGDPYGHDPTEVSTAAELFVSDELKIAAIQIRSGLEAKYALHFFEKLKQFILDVGFKDVLIFASTHEYELHNISSGRFRYISNENIEAAMQTLKVDEMEKSETGQYLLHGAGYCLKLYETLSSNLKCSMLIKYVSEGDNRPDAYMLLGILYKFVSNFKGMDARYVKEPSSWQHVFGNPPPVGLY